MAEVSGSVIMPKTDDALKILANLTQDTPEIQEMIQEALLNDATALDTALIDCAEAIFCDLDQEEAHIDDAIPDFAG